MKTQRMIVRQLLRNGSLFFLSVLISTIVLSQTIPAKPSPPRLVNDLANVLSPDQEAALEAKLVAYDDSTSNQVVILTVKTLNDQPIEEYALKVLREWQVGNKTTNNGIVIVAAIEDRLVRIETGYGLEGAVPDITANHIIQNDIAPAFRSEDYYDGLNKATESVILAAAGEYQAPTGYRKKSSGKSAPGGLVFAIIVIIFILSRINRGGGGGGGFMSRRGYRGGLGPMIFFPGSGGFGGGGGGFGGGGGGFGGFGGGSGGGGGASGSW